MEASEIGDHTDYYELLNVDEDVQPNELKKAYYKAAMKWHPDRNPQNIKEATRVFQLIEHAYSVLSDQHERAWYDGHRNNGEEAEGLMAATKVDIMGLFNAGAFQGFNDNKHGFFTVFRNAFSQLAQEEKAQAPTFGDSRTSWKDVETFYSFWSCFVTKRSFAYADKYKLTEAPNAFYRREMSKENTKLKQKAEREFVTAVRELVGFVKKRDPRVTSQIELIAKQKAERAAEEERKRNEKKQKEMEEIPEFHEYREYTENDLLYLKEFDEVEDKEWKCEYCQREMANESVFKSHCETKKHRKNTTIPREDFLNNPTLYEHTAYIFTLLGLTSDEIERINPSVDMSKIVSPLARKEEAPENIVVENNEEEEEEEEDEKNNKKSKQILTKKERRKIKLQKDKERKEKIAAQALAQEAKTEKKGKPINREESVDMFSQPRSTKKQKKLDEVLDNLDEPKPTESMNDEEEAKSEPKKKKTDQKQKKTQSTQGGAFVCRRCRAAFSSKTKLFSHLEESGHAIAK